MLLHCVVAAEVVISALSSKAAVYIAGDQGDGGDELKCPRTKVGTE